MTKDEAEAETARLRRAHSDRLFAARERPDGSWEVVEARVPGAPPHEPERHAETRSGPEVTPDPTEDQAPPVWSQRGF